MIIAILTLLDFIHLYDAFNTINQFTLPVTECL